jgi:hypothetical protein
MIKVAMGLLASGLVAVPAEAGPVATGTQAAAEFSAQRPRARLRVTPDRRPLLYRDCDFRLVQQWRPGGPVIVPWQRCWWVRG